MIGRRFAVCMVLLAAMAAGCAPGAFVAPRAGTPSPRASSSDLAAVTPAVTVSATPTAAAPTVSSTTAAAPRRSDGTPGLGRFPEVPTAALPDRTGAALQAILDTAVKDGLPGISATLLSADRGVWAGAAGTADGAHPVEPRTQFALASVTKMVIAAEVMRLSEEGLLQLSDPVSKHLPADLAFDTNGATIRNLLAMESGLPDSTLHDGPEMNADPLRVWTASEILAHVPRYGYTKPGTVPAYTNTNFILLGLVIEQTTGMSVAAALRADVLADPRLATIVYQPEERPDGPLAAPFVAGEPRPDITKDGGGYLPGKALTSAMAGSGAMASDSGALALWGYLLFGGQLISERSLAAMTDFGGDDYGLGTIDFVKKWWEEGWTGEVIGHGGWAPRGHASMLMVLPIEGTVVSVLSNRDDTRTDFPSTALIAHQLASALER